MRADSSGLGANRVLIRFKPEGIETSEERPRSLRFSAAITGRVVTKTLIEDLSGYIWWLLPGNEGGDERESERFMVLVSFFLLECNGVGWF